MPQKKYNEEGVYFASGRALVVQVQFEEITSLSYQCEWI